ncbi:MAG: hypothetical protein EON98_06475 [Chitinophagaceae bacterium]|nr:MAG: hypothetical protein EON98_06475 [Chitinophagaceae bacterium]
MKKSNILLVAGFLAIVVFISAIHISLYAKYKAGDYTIYHADEDLLADALQTFPNIAFVSVQNVPNATIKFSDVAAVEKSDKNDLLYTRSGDTLLIRAGEDANPDRIAGQIIYLPYNTTLNVSNSSLFFVPGKKMAESTPVIYLKKSSVMFGGTRSQFQLKSVKVVATDSSSVLFQGNTQVAVLDVQLSQSSLEYADGDFGQLSIVTDSLSRISLLSKHLLKANIKTIAPR